MLEIKYFTQNITLTGELKDFVEEKILKLNKFVDTIWEARVDLSYSPTHNKNQVFRLEINLRLPDKILRGVARGPDLQTALDIVDKKLRRQIEKYRGTWQKRKRKSKKATGK
ncbi:ribosome-associated translation inhibitor RaiA [Patescibacteria group bacterium AH-259-L05]|nr:ribosome-associated translation inhibitor RaiA [Patescibacteria group bacterium AH-259-L05]